MSSSGVNLQNFLIPLEEINHATENFSSKRYIGGGGFGKVYKGELSERWQNRTAAIKRLSKDSYQGEHEFRNEVEIISRFRHENIISFIGYCDEENEMIIVYEYASSGSLDNHLSDPKKRCCLTWAQRLEICKGAAKGLNYLHSGLGEHRVIHRDVKSANILLDDNLVAKICDFGLSKFGSSNEADTQLYTKVAGTQFYLDPTYHESGILHKESDVYSFGVVLFEMLSGLLAYSRRSIRDTKPQTLMNLVRRYYHKEPDKLIDPDIRDHINNDSFDTYIKIAYRCISFNLTERPMMDTVFEMIEEAFDFQIVAILIECVKVDIGFSDGKPVAAFIIYKSLLHYKYLEAEKANVFDQLIQIIVAALEDQDDNKMAYWLSNASNLLFLIHKSLELHGESSVTPQTSLFGRMAMVFRSSMSSVDDDLSEAEASLKVVQKVEAKEPALLFKQQLTEFVEKIYFTFKENYMKELRPLLDLCSQGPQTSMEGLRSEQSFRNESEFSNWQCIVDHLNTLLNTLKENFVPPIIVQKLFANLFSFINMKLFDSLLLEVECCHLSSVKHVKTGLAKLKLWCSQEKKEYVGSAWDELNHIRQATKFLLLLHNNRIRYGEQIDSNVCPILSEQQMIVLGSYYVRDIVGQHVGIVPPSSGDILWSSFSMPSFLEDLSTSLQVKDFANVKRKNFRSIVPFIFCTTNDRTSTYYIME